MFELPEIMRQMESKTFARILNGLREGLYTHDDIVKLNERICSNQTESEALYHISRLFIQNKRVEEFSLLMHNKAPGPKFVIQAIDSVDVGITNGAGNAVNKVTLQSSTSTIHMELSGLNVISNALVEKPLKGTYNYILKAIIRLGRQ